MYLLVAGTQDSKPISPYRVNPRRGNDYYGLHPCARTGNILVWDGTLKPGQAVDLVVTVAEQDNSQLGALKNLATNMLAAAATLFTAGFTAAASVAFDGATTFGSDLARSLGTSVDQVIGTYHVRIQNVDGQLAVKWLPGIDAQLKSSHDDAYGAHAHVAASGATANYELQTSVREV